MKKMILLMLVLGLVLTAGIVSAGEFIECRCWRLSPYQDTIKVCAPTGYPLALNFFPATVTGSWVIDAGGNHKDLIPMVGTLQADLDGRGIRLQLQGTVKDLSLGNPTNGNPYVASKFIHQCIIDANLGPGWASINLPVPPSTTPLKSSVFAYCEDYFGPDSPFGSNPNQLVPIHCYGNPQVLNPVNPGEVGEN